MIKRKHRIREMGGEEEARGRAITRGPFQIPWIKGEAGKGEGERKRNGKERRKG